MEKKEIKCVYCEYKTEIRGNLIRHHKTKHKKKELKLEKYIFNKRKPRPKMYRCYKCKYMTPSDSSYFTHLKSKEHTNNIKIEVIKNTCDKTPSIVNMVKEKKIQINNKLTTEELDKIIKKNELKDLVQKELKKKIIQQDNRSETSSDESSEESSGSEESDEEKNMNEERIKNYEFIDDDSESSDEKKMEEKNEIDEFIRKNVIIEDDEANEWTKEVYERYKDWDRESKNGETKSFEEVMEHFEKRGFKIIRNDIYGMNLK